MTDEPSLVAELARMTALFQLRTVALHMGADPDSIDPATLTLTVGTDSRAAYLAADAARRGPLPMLGGKHHSEVSA